MKKYSTEEVKFWGEEYGKVYPQLEVARPYKKLIKDMNEAIGQSVSGKWLDVGCGSGAMVEIIWQASAGKAEEITAFDLTETMLKYTQDKVDKLLAPGDRGKIKLLQHDLSYKLPFADGYFDGIVANLVLPYVINHEGAEGKAALRAVLREMYRVLKPGGKFVWSSPVKNVNFWMVFFSSWREILDPREIKNLYYGPAILSHALKIQKKGKDSVYSFLDKAELAELLESLDFKDIEIKRSFAGQALVLKSSK
ncbi:class I SAM-dependent methyltransferase [Candidatus Falkowbacteria bacterium]|nr:class I SAM-dependent methyltransferase [Candidatus Falkowbacteria bacterium]